MVRDGEVRRHQSHVFLQIKVQRIALSRMAMRLHCLQLIG